MAGKRAVPSQRVDPVSPAARAESISSLMSGGKIYSLADFRPLIDRLGESGASYALIGGLAVALYGEKYLPGERKGHFRFPVCSKDLDFQGTPELKTIVTAEAAALGWRQLSRGVRRPKPALKRPISHWITLEVNGCVTSIEVLEALPVEEMGFADETIGSWVTVDGIVVLDPCTLLIAKLAALHGRPQGEENNDAQHCEILAEVIPLFLRDIESLRSERRVEYEPLADTWRLLLVLEREKFPLPLGAEAAAEFEQWLRQFTVSTLVREGKLAPEAEARAVSEELLVAHGLSDAGIAEIRVLYTVAGWYRAVLFACQGAPSHVALIDAAGRSLARPDAERALTYDRLSGGILHTLHYMEPVEPKADPADVARARAAYLRWVTDECGTMQLDGLPADADLSVKRMKLEDLFVPLRLELYGEQQLSMDFDLLSEPQGRPERVETVGTMLESNPRLAILAAPGGGKSTLLKRIASAYADPERLAEVADDLPRRQWLPFFLRCRELHAEATLPIMEILDGLGRHLGGDAQAFRLHLRDALSSGHALLLIDGLDEISDDAARRAFAEHLRSFLRTYPEIALVVTSREAGFRIVAGAIADVCTQARLAPFDEADVERLCVNWHVEVVGNTDKVRADARELAAQIWANDRIRSLVTNPLLLTTLLVVKRWVGQLPQRRVTLYSKAVEVLLMTWNVEGHTPINDEEALPQLSYLACWMMEQGVQRIARSQLLDLLKKARRELESELFGTKLTPDEFIERIERRSSLLIQVGHEVVEEHLQPVYEFQHLTFQEYLAARGYVQDHRPGAHDGKRLVDLLEPHFLEDKWREVIALAVVLAKRDASEIVERLTAATGGLLEENRRFTGGKLTLVACMLDEPPINPAAALAAFQVIVRTPSVFGDRDLPVKLAQSRFAPLLLETATKQFQDLTSNYSYIADFLAACTAVERGYPWTAETFPSAAESLVTTITQGSDGERIRACVVVLGLLMGELSMPWERNSSPFVEFSNRAGDACLTLLAQGSRALLVAAGWCLGKIGKFGLWQGPVSIAHLETLVSLIGRFRDSPPGGQLCYAFSGLPLLDRDGFVLARTGSLGALIPLLEAIGEKVLEQNNIDSDVSLQAMTVLSWYRRGPWTDAELAGRIQSAFGDDHALVAREMLGTLGAEGQAVLDEWGRSERRFRSLDEQLLDNFDL